MNLLLFRPEELDQGVGTARGERAAHIRTVLKKTVGDSLKVGVLGRGKGLGEIISDTPDQIRVRVGELEAVTPPQVHLIVALPRPLALSRLLHTSASFGVRHIDLIRAWKVPRSYFDSPRLRPERINADLRLGAEQGGQSSLPTFAIHEGFRSFVESIDDSPNAAAPERRFVLDPEAPRTFAPPLRLNAPLSLAFGPEGGFIPSELESFERASFSPVRLGPAILTTEIAIAATLAQLALLDSWAGVSC